MTLIRRVHAQLGSKVDKKDLDYPKFALHDINTVVRSLSVQMRHVPDNLKLIEELLRVCLLRYRKMLWPYKDKSKFQEALSLTNLLYTL